MVSAPQRALQGEDMPLSRRMPLWVFRIAALLAGIAMFFPPANPGRVSEKINASASLFTNGVSYGTITNSMGRILRSQWIQDADITLLMIACIVVMLGVILCGVGGCMSLGNRRMRRRGFVFPLIGAPVMAAGLLLIRLSYNKMVAHGEEVDKLDKINMMIPGGFWVFCAFAGLLFLTALIAFLTTEKETDPAVKMEMDEKYRLFLMMLPVILLTLIFAYLPIWGWRFAFFDYTPGGSIGPDNYVGFKWFSFLFSDPATTKDLIRVLRNTLVISLLGLVIAFRLPEGRVARLMMGIPGVAVRFITRAQISQQMPMTRVAQKYPVVLLPSSKNTPYPAAAIRALTGMVFQGWCMSTEKAAAAKIISRYDVSANGDLPFPMPGLASGGVLSRGSAYVGETGPELLTVSNGNAVVQPLTNNYTTNNYNSAPAAGGGQPVDVTLLLDSATLARVMVQPNARAVSLAGESAIH